MDSSFERVVLDQSKCSKLSMEKKRELVYELSKWSHGAPEMLQSWSRQDILQILCAEMGKERKYTGLTKLKIIENLLKIVSEKKSLQHGTSVDLEMQSSPTNPKGAKRQRKIEHPSRLPVAAINISVSTVECEFGNVIYCKNSACKANLAQEDAFCKRCSCCICYQYDDNKDPSLWLICSSEPPFQGNSCGMSCHLECALKHQRSGIAKDGQRAGLDGSFCCVSCGKVNDLLGCWRKQLVIAKDTRRVDILCYRVSLSQKLIIGTEKYRNLYDIVDEAVKKLEVEVGPLTGIPVKMGRGIVNRLSSGPEVQKLCALAVELLDSMLSNYLLQTFCSPIIQGSNLLAPSMIRFEVVSATSLTVILGSEHPSSEDIVNYTLWHRMAHETDYPIEPTCTSLAPNARFLVSGLTPGIEYFFKVVSCNGKRELGMCEVRFAMGGMSEEVQKSLVVERSQSPTTNCSSLSNPSSVEDETNNVTPYHDLNENRLDNYFNICKDSGKTVSGNTSNGTINCNSIDQEATLADSVSVLDEERATGINGSAPTSDVLENDNKHLPEAQNIEEISIDNGSNSPAQTGLECVPFVGSSEAGLPITPCKLEIFKDGVGRSGRPKPCNKDMDKGSGKVEEPQAGSSSKKRSGERCDEECDRNSPSDRDFEYHVKVIRWLECEGHIEKNFRQKFLTWYSLRATSQEVRMVKVFIDTFIEDPASLAEQLVDTFSDSISSKRSSVVPAGFCMKLWH